MADATTGGASGLFYPAVAKGGGARTSALVPGLSQDESVRSNLAVVNTGGGSELPVPLEVRPYDAAAGAAPGSPLSAWPPAGHWAPGARVPARSATTVWPVPRPHLRRRRARSPPTRPARWWVIFLLNNINGVENL